MKRIALAAALAAFGLASSCAQAGTVAVSAGAGTNFRGFDDSSVGDVSGATLAPWGLVSFSGPGVEDTSVGGQYAQPYGDATRYFYATGGSDAVLTWAKPVTSVDIYWGSVDSYNGITLTNGDTVAMADVLGLLGAGGSGWVRLASATPFTGLTATSGQAAFEFDFAAAPEASTWAMMLLGFAGLGFLGFRSRRRSVSLVD